MRTIGIRELKAQLSAVLRDVQRGDIVLVTDRGRVIAELRSPEHARAMSADERVLAKLAGEGQLRIAERPVSPYQRSPITSPDGTARELLDAERSER
jgi:prevent-host-death family protein